MSEPEVGPGESAPRYVLLGSPCHLCGAGREHHTCEREVTRLRTRLAAAEEQLGEWTKRERCPVCRHDAPHVGCVTATVKGLGDQLAAARRALEGKERECERMRADVVRLGQAILWADGQHEDFRPRERGEGAYWWRKELMRRAGITPSTRALLAPERPR